MDNDKIINVREWFKYANDDFDVVNLLLSLYPYKVNIMCFHCQQAAEKMLKAFILHMDTEIPKIHDLNVLRNMCAANDETFSDILNECADLNIYSSKPRYPSGSTITEENMHQAIKDCRAVIEFVISKIDYADFSFPAP